MTGNSIFALDIGTRKVIGLVMQKTAAGCEIIDAELIEHRTRAMLDGQIHDVEAVAEVIGEVKQRLEGRLGYTLETAAVAAAGRALKTARGKAERLEEGAGEITRNESLALEIEAVQDAQMKLAREESDDDRDSYFCVGYSVVNYYLEGQQIGKLIGQVGDRRAVEVIATFLPRVVVDSLFSALKKAGLEVHSMTLEPIAALAMAVPQNMRILNLALVDIGAGTSDIAIVKDGNIFAYAMVPIGGDELTEKIGREHLLDFTAAEEVKVRLGHQEKVQMVDILGNESEMPSDQVIACMESVVHQLVSEVSAQIMALNSKAPDAVICVGGGSLTPNLPRTLAESMELPANRVGLRTNQNSRLVSTTVDFLNGAQGITPLGIAYSAFEKESLPLFKVNVNGRDISIWDAGSMDVGKALLSAGTALNNIFGRPGMGKTIQVNGEVRLYKGGLGGQPTVTVNGQTAAFDDPVRSGDRIVFKKGEDGRDASVKVKDVVSLERRHINVNGKHVDIGPNVIVNGEKATPNMEIPDRARVEIHTLATLKDLLEEIGVEPELLESTSFRVYINDEEKRLKWTPVEIKVNGQAAGLDDPIVPGSEVEYETTGLVPLITDVLGLEMGNASIKINVNGLDYQLPVLNYKVTADSRPVQLSEPVRAGMRLKVEKIDQSAILSDVFKLIDFRAKSNGRLVMTVNGEAAGFTTPVAENSVIELRWD